mgnify:FL=1
MMATNIKRRLFLQQSVLTGLTGNAVAIGLLRPRVVFAAWDQNSFDSRTVSEGIKNGLGAASAALSEQILIEAPDIAADGATVRVVVEAKLAEVQSIALLAEKNPRPLCYIFHPGAGVRPKMTARIKMGESGDVVAVVKAGGKLYMARRNVTVTAGGCA